MLTDLDSFCHQLLTVGIQQSKGVAQVVDAVIGAVEMEHKFRNVNTTVESEIQSIHSAQNQNTEPYLETPSERYLLPKMIDWS